VLDVLVAKVGLQGASSWHDDLHSVLTSFGTRILVFKTNGYGPSIKLGDVWSLSANSHFGP
jgi:hypothetical protein